MKTTIRNIGNSRGVIIPAAFLSEAGLQNEVEIILKDKAIIIEPIKTEPRKDWFNTYQLEVDEDAWDGFIALPGEDKEWEW
jgi:antitoxin MazE